MYSVCQIIPSLPIHGFELTTPACAPLRAVQHEVFNRERARDGIGRGVLLCSVGRVAKLRPRPCRGRVLAALAPARNTK